MGKKRFMGFGKSTKEEPKTTTDDFTTGIDRDIVPDEDGKPFDLDELEGIVKPAMPTNTSLPPVTAAPAVSFPTQEFAAPPIRGDQESAVVSKGMNITGDMNIGSGDLYVYGSIKGEVTVEGTVIMDAGKIIGNVSCKGIRMSNNASIKGNVTIIEAKNNDAKINDSHIDGNILGANNLDLDGKSEVLGIVEAKNMVTVDGKITGDHIKAGRLSFGEHSNITAKIQARSMSVATGAAICGAISIVKESA